MDQRDEMNVDELISSVDELVKDYHPAETAEPEPEIVSGDTIRLDQIRKAVSETAESSMEHTAVFTPVEDEEFEPQTEPAEPVGNVYDIINKTIER